MSADKGTAATGHQGQFETPAAGSPDHLHVINRLIRHLAADPTDPVPTRESPRFSTISLLTQTEIPDIFTEWQDSLRVESVITKSTHFVALLEHPRNSPHRAAWVSILRPIFIRAAIQAPGARSLPRTPAARIRQQPNLLKDRSLIPIDMFVSQFAIAKPHNGHHRHLDMPPRRRDTRQNPRHLHRMGKRDYHLLHPLMLTTVRDTSVRVKVRRHAKLWQFALALPPVITGIWLTYASATIVDNMASTSGVANSYFVCSSQNCSRSYRFNAGILRTGSVQV